MEELLEAIRAKLRSALSYVRANDVFVTEDENVMPEETGFPAIGLKDGPVKTTEKAGGMLEHLMTVKVIVLVELDDAEDGILGNAATGKKGVLGIEKDVHAALDQQLLGIAGMLAAVRGKLLPESELFGGDGDALQRKIVPYEYTKEEARP